jgi:hypothetical protein
VCGKEFARSLAWNNSRLNSEIPQEKIMEIIKKKKSKKDSLRIV